jgi:hypothetical protein
VGKLPSFAPLKHERNYVAIDGFSEVAYAAIAAERAVIQHMLAGQGRIEPILSPREAATLSEQPSSLNSEQRAAVEHVLTSPDRVQGIQGSAGAGKTTALEVIRSQAEGRGFEVEGFAPTSRASKQLRQAGIPAGTCRRFWREQLTRTFPGRSTSTCWMSRVWPAQTR